MQLFFSIMLLLLGPLLMLWAFQSAWISSLPDVNSMYYEVQAIILFIVGAISLFAALINIVCIIVKLKIQYSKKSTKQNIDI